MALCSTLCLTRVVVDDHAWLDVAQIDAVMRRIQAALQEIPEGERTFIANALFRVAVAQRSARMAIE